MATDVARRALRWPHVVPAGWFVLTVVASGLLTLLQIKFPGLGAPVQSAARLLLIGMTLVSALVVGRTATGLIGRTAVPIVAFVASALGSFLMAFSRDSASSDAVASFMFMYSVGMLLVLFLLAPIVVRAGVMLKIFSALVVAFGLLQILRQDLMLPDAYRAQFGVVYDRFVNGNVRVISFFASPPRYAEFLVFVASYLQFGILTGRRRSLPRIAAYAIVLFVLYNTFSRSGYLLFLTVFAVQLVLIQRHVLKERTSSGALRLFLVFAGILAAGGLLIAGRLPFDASVVDVTSLDARQGHWTDVFQRFEGESVGDLLLGSGESAHYPVLSPRYFVLDNVALAILLYSGLVGLAIFLWLYYRLFCEGLRAQALGGEERWTPMLAFYPSLLIEGMFVDNHNTIFVVQFTILGMIVWDRISRNTDDSWRRSGRGYRQTAHHAGDGALLPDR